MSAKILKTKRGLLFVVYNNLRKMPPKEFLTTQEIKVTIEDILPVLKKGVSEYNDILDSAAELNSPKTAEMKEEEKAKKVQELNDKWKNYDWEHGNDVVELEIKKEAFTILTEQFNRDNWGKNWFNTLENYQEFSDNITEAGK